MGRAIDMVNDIYRLKQEVKELKEVLPNKNNRADANKSDKS